jgi:hypothetical protein
VRALRRALVALESAAMDFATKTVRPKSLGFEFEVLADDAVIK